MSYFKTINNTSGGGSGGGGISSQGGIIGGGGSTSTQLPYLQITGSQSTIPAYDTNPITTQDGCNISGTNLTLGGTNGQVSIGQTISNGIITQWANGDITGNQLRTITNLNLPVNTVISAPCLNQGTYIVSQIDSSYYTISQSYNLGVIALCSVSNGTTLTLSQPDSRIQVGMCVGIGSYIPLISGSGTVFTLGSSVANFTNVIQRFTVIYTYQSNVSIPSNTIITGGTGLNWTLNRSLSYSNISLSFYNPNVFIQPANAQLENLNVIGGLTLPSNQVISSTQTLVDTTSSQTISGQKQFTTLLTNGINVKGGSSTIPAYDPNPFTQTGCSISGTTLTLGATNNNVIIGQQITGDNGITTSSSG